MIDVLKTRFDELNSKKLEAQPKIDELNEAKSKEIELIENRYSKLISDVSVEVTKLEKEVYNEFISSFEKIIMFEFDAKRSTSEYKITAEIKDYLNYMKGVDFYPGELIEKLENVVTGAITIEDVAYSIDSIIAKFQKN